MRFTKTQQLEKNGEVQNLFHQNKKIQWKVLWEFLSRIFCFGEGIEHFTIFYHYASVHIPTQQLGLKQVINPIVAGKLNEFRIAYMGKHSSCVFLFVNCTRKYLFVCLFICQLSFQNAR